MGGEYGYCIVTDNGMMKAWKLARYAFAGWLPGGRRYCVVCNHRVWRFMPCRGEAPAESPRWRAQWG